MTAIRNDNRRMALLNEWGEVCAHSFFSRSARNASSIFAAVAKYLLSDLVNGKHLPFCVFFRAVAYSWR